ncbi:actin-like family protein [Cystoisospora suis]|uniref:Actin-like family protein n=1 Tax=Cystoisospora suis TaxID=483139 RepID=A0A2C6LA95_9APIC|nr:actin-like family protein [Cystoisospora suis]
MEPAGTDADADRGRTGGIEATLSPRRGIAASRRSGAHFSVDEDCQTGEGTSQPSWISRRLSHLGEEEVERRGDNTDALVVVLETGTSELRMGFAGDSEPRVRLPAFIARVETEEASDQSRDLYLSKTAVGAEAFRAAAEGTATKVVRAYGAHPHHPLAASKESYDNLFALWNAALNQLLRANGRSFSLQEGKLLALLATVPVVCDQRLASCLLRWAFRTRGDVFGAVKLVADARMAAYHHILLHPDALSPEKGVLVVDVGEVAVRAVPVCGNALTPWRHGLRQTDTAGALLTELLLLHQPRRGEENRGRKRGLDWADATEYKKQCFFVSLNPSLDLQLHRKHRQMHPPFLSQDGVLLQPSSDAFLIPEVLFTPQLLRNANLSAIVNSMTQPSLSHLVLEAFASATVCERAPWLSRICLVGGTARIPNFQHRLREELQSAWQSSNPSAYMQRKETVNNRRCEMPGLATANCSIRVIVSDDPQLAVFRGASDFGRVAVLDESAWVTAEQYAEASSVSCLEKWALHQANFG